MTSVIIERGGGRRLRHHERPGPDGTHSTVADLDCERILRKPVLGGLTNEYARAA
jgi:hypothetical protein